MSRFGSIYSKVAAFATSAFVLGAVAPQSEASTVYAFGQQKVYNMTLTGVTNPQGIAGSGLGVRTSTSANLNGNGTSSNVPAQDATQSVLGIPAPPENMSGPNPTGGVGNTTVLIQADTTPAGVANAVSPGVPGLADLNQNSFSRADVLMRIPPPALGNNLVDARWLFQPGFGVGNDTNMALDSAAEGEITGLGTGSSTSTWTVSGQFVLGAPDQVQLMFNMIQRLVAFNNASGGEIGLADANMTLAWDIRDAAGISVFSASYGSLLSINSPPPPANTGLTDNFSTAGATHLGIFISNQLAAGSYSYSINGKTNVDVSLVPEPASYVMMGLGLVAMGGLRFRRKLLAQPASAE